MKKATVYCINTETDSIGDILEKSDKRIKVVLENDVSLVLNRRDTRFPYTATTRGLEFETFGVVES